MPSPTNSPLAVSPRRSRRGAWCVCYFTQRVARTTRILLLALPIALLLAACAPPTFNPAPGEPSSGGQTPAITPGTTPLTPTATLSLPVPQPIVEIPLDGPAAIIRAEFSGMAWYGDSLILLPQYPSRFGSGDGAFFVLSKAEIEAFLDGSHPGPLVPRLLPVDAPGLTAHFTGYQGLESIAFDGERVYLTVETGTLGGGMTGWIVAGEIAPDMSVLRVDVESAQAIPPQADMNNMTDEAIVLVGSGEAAALLTIYEANGRLINDQPVAHRFAADLTPLEPLPFPPVEYRITDATPADADGRFWAINYFYPGDVQLKADSDPLLRLIVRNLPQVERLVEFRVTDEGVRFADSPPVYLELLADDARNWEGIARLDDRGFLLVTDYHPRTILAFVAKP